MTAMQNAKSALGTGLVSRPCLRFSSGPCLRFSRWVGCSAKDSAVFRHQPQNDVAHALARLAHGPHAVDHHRLDFDEALALPALHGPPCRALGQRRGAISCRRF
jgi:hypothetical protein